MPHDHLVDRYDDVEALAAILRGGPPTSHWRQVWLGLSRRAIHERFHVARLPTDVDSLAGELLSDVLLAVCREPILWQGRSATRARIFIDEHYCDRRVRSLVWRSPSSPAVRRLSRPPFGYRGSVEENAFAWAFHRRIRRALRRHAVECSVPGEPPRFHLAGAELADTPGPVDPVAILREVGTAEVWPAVQAALRAAAVPLSARELSNLLLAAWLTLSDGEPEEPTADPTVTRAARETWAQLAAYEQEVIRCTALRVEPQTSTAAAILQNTEDRRRFFDRIRLMLVRRLPGAAMNDARRSPDAEAIAEALFDLVARDGLPTSGRPPAEPVASAALGFLGAVTPRSPAPTALLSNLLPLRPPTDDRRMAVAVSDSNPHPIAQALDALCQEWSEVRETWYDVARAPVGPQPPELPEGFPIVGAPISVGIGGGARLWVVEGREGVYVTVDDFVDVDILDGRTHKPVPPADWVRLVHVRVDELVTPDRRASALVRCRS